MLLRRQRWKALESLFFSFLIQCNVVVFFKVTVLVFASFLIGVFCLVLYSSNPQYLLIFNLLLFAAIGLFSITANLTMNIDKTKEGK
jgi:hypothetical protein